MKHINPINTNDTHIPIISLSEKEREQSDRAYRKFLRRRGLPVAISYPKWEKE